MEPIKLPFWLEGVELSKLRDAATAYWAMITSLLQWPLTQFDALTCSIGILNLLAYQRDIQRFKDEPLELYRKRVGFAYINAKDAGSKAGFIAIFARLGIGYIEIQERVDPVDWDVVLLRLSDSQISNNIELLQNIVETYGRTCRRYEFLVITPVPVTSPAWAVGHVYSYDVAGV
ncbi:phage tail protein [Methylobacter sp. S3L5C]|uniref:phage tail protein n=1 Tax=Methylobacter sp. S3L5C TaxID=2839024 RepID=UPI001FAD6B92|nr:phage tail protein [Methylobacter sp. S3L5C]UOA08616.1 phage tail protein [Methylobacter sp. S3L5C]